MAELAHGYHGEIRQLRAEANFLRAKRDIERAQIKGILGDIRQALAEAAEGIDRIAEIERDGAS